MGTKKHMYQIVGRYMEGSKVTGYHLQDFAAGDARRFDREIVAYLVGKGQVTNAEGQIYQDKLLLRGVGMNISDLPVQNERTGAVSKTDNVGKIRKGAEAGDIMTQVNLVAAFVNGRSTVGYRVQNTGGATHDVPRDKIIEMAKAGRIGNARVQVHQGKILLRGVNCDLNGLEKIPVGNP